MLIQTYIGQTYSQRAQKKSKESRKIFHIIDFGKSQELLDKYTEQIFIKKDINTFIGYGEQMQNDSWTTGQRNYFEIIHHEINAFCLGKQLVNEDKYDEWIKTVKIYMLQADILDKKWEIWTGNFFTVQHD